MANSDPPVEIPPQPNPDVPKTELESISYVDLGRDLQDLRDDIPLQPKPIIPPEAIEKTAPAGLEEDLGSLKRRGLAAEVRTKELGADDLSSQLEMRRDYASRIFKLSGCWLGFIGLSLILAGQGKLKIADSVQIALITTTTINVLGLFYIVARWLFPNKGNNELPDNQAKATKSKRTKSKKARAKNDQLT